MRMSLATHRPFAIVLGVPAHHLLPLQVAGGLSSLICLGAVPLKEPFAVLTVRAHPAIKELGRQIMPKLKLKIRYYLAAVAAGQVPAMHDTPHKHYTSDEVLTAVRAKMKELSGGSFRGPQVLSQWSQRSRGPCHHVDPCAW